MAIEFGNHNEFDFEKEKPFIRSHILRVVYHEGGYIDSIMGGYVAVNYFYGKSGRHHSGVPVYTKKEAQPFFDLLDLYETKLIKTFDDACTTFIDKCRHDLGEAWIENLEQCRAQTIQRIRLDCGAKKQSFVDPTYSSVPTTIDQDKIDAMIARCERYFAEIFDTQKSIREIQENCDNIQLVYLSGGLAISDRPDFRILEAGQIPSKINGSFYADSKRPRSVDKKDETNIQFGDSARRYKGKLRDKSAHENAKFGQPYMIKFEEESPFTKAMEQSYITMWN